MADSTSSGTAAAVGVTIAILACLLLGVLIFFYIRKRREAAGQGAEPERGVRHSTVLDRMHPASRVTPFSPGGEAPRFTHTPGEDMRVARRRSDGGWEFSEPLTIKPPTLFPGIDSACPSPTSSISTSTIFRKEKKMPGDLTTRGFVELDSEGLPPPAYTPR